MAFHVGKTIVFGGLVGGILSKWILKFCQVVFFFLKKKWNLRDTF